MGIMEERRTTDRRGLPEGRDDSFAPQALLDAARPLAMSLVCSASFLILLAWLSEEVFEGGLRQFDLAVRMLVHKFFSPQVTQFMQAMTFLGSIGFLSALFVILIAAFLFRGLKRAAAWLTIAVGGSIIL